MKINTEYKKSIKNNYMVIDIDASVRNGYEVHMISDCDIRGFLSCRFSDDDGHAVMYYDITSKNSLSRIMDTGKMGEEDLRKIVFYILHAIEECRRYLLDEDAIILDSDHVYIDCSSYKVGLCYMPGYKASVKQQLRSLLAECPTAMDSDDKSAVMLAYNLYSEVCREDFVMEDILTVLSRASGVQPMNTGSRLTGAADEEKVVSDIESDTARTDSKKRGIVKLPPISLPWGSKKEKTTKQEISDDMIMNPSSIETDDSWIGNFEQTETPHTEYIASRDIKKTTVGRLVALDQDTEDIEIQYVPYIIGRQSRIADCVLDRDGISRMHLRIDRDADGDYMVTDLNSRNGSSVNGVPLTGEQEVGISEGDIICMAGLSYRLE